MRRIIGLLVLILALGDAQTVGSARILEQSGQLERALSEYRLALRKQPQNLSAFQGFRRISVQLEGYDSLVAVSERLLKAAPWELQFALGKIDGLFGLKRRKQALTECRRAAKRWPEQIPLLVGVLEHWKEYSEATRYLVRMRSSKRDELLYADRLVELYEYQGRYAQAVHEIVGIVNRRAGSLDGYLEKLKEYARKAGSGPLLAELGKVKAPLTRARAQAEVFLALGNEDEAVKRVRKVMNKDALCRFAHKCEQSGALNAALEIYREQNLYPDQARVLRKLGHGDAALRVLAQDDTPGALFELAELYRLENKEYQKAAQVYGRVLKHWRNHEPALFGLASSQVALGQLNRALVTLRRTKSPTDRVLFLLVQVFFYQMEFDSSQGYVSELVHRFPNSVLVNDGLELVLLSHSGERSCELARAMLELKTGVGNAAVRRCLALTAGDDAVAEQAYFLLAQIVRSQGKPKDALAILDEFIERFEQSPRRARARFEQVEIVGNDLKDENKYRQTLEEFVVDFPGSPYAPVARSLLAEANRPVEPGEIR